jgi:hypothetical protein
MGGLTRLEFSPATAGAFFNLPPWRMWLHNPIALSERWDVTLRSGVRFEPSRSAVRKNAFRNCPFTHSGNTGTATSSRGTERRYGAGGETSYQGVKR